MANKDFHSLQLMQLVRLTLMNCNVSVNNARIKMGSKSAR